MNTPSANYTIYNASAGSGKTYSLVKAYLRIILGSKQPDLFRQLLAITFTNKAVFEMKNRIIELLGVFSEDRMLTQPHAMFSELAKELNLPDEELRTRSTKALEHILHNYAAFNISTIDGFNHQLIRHFSQDLHLNPFFEVQLDSKALLERAVDNLMNQAGNDPELTQLLIDFANEKIEDDKSWDTTKELLGVAEMLTNENHYEQLQSLKDKEIPDFLILKNTLLKQRNNALKSIKTSAQDFMQLMCEHGLDKGAFNGGHLYKFFDNLTADNSKEPSWGSGWQNNLLEGEPLYSGSAGKKYDTALIDSLQETIANLFLAIKEAFGALAFANNALRYVVPLALLNRIQKEIETIKEEENILPIWEFNGVISSELSNQPAPFIYERIGEKFRHYFIDEFQDTSVLQWQNFIPLILNAVQSEVNNKCGSVLLVGDAKQSIYRWRGGKAEQFMSLYNNEVNPFRIKGEVKDLNESFRSLEAIINFNNHFFKFAADLFQSETYKELYKNSTQEYPKNKKDQSLPEGYFNLSFIEVGEEEVPTEEDNSNVVALSPRERSYCEAILEKIEHANRAGAADKDITILVRTNREGAAVASFLSEQQRNVISPDSLLLKNVASVQFLVTLLRLLYHPESEELKLQLLFDYLRFKETKDPHLFLSKYVEEPVNTFLADFHFSIELFNQYSLYEGVALAVNCFDLARSSDAYLTHFMDIVFDFKNARKGGLSDFLEFWDDQQEKLSISSPEGLNAITVMTVHKSKGLSAPVIIYAFADSKLIDTHTEKLWFPVDHEQFNGFDYLLVNSNKSLVNYDAQAEELMMQLHEQNLLDQLNVLYVAMTRPESFLYVITSLSKSSAETYGTLFKEFLEENGQWNSDIVEYTFGSAVFPKKKEKETTEESPIPFQKGWQYPNYKIATGASLLWDTHQQEALERGNLIHELFSKITYATDLDAVLNDALQEGTLTAEQYELLQPQMARLLSDSTLAPFFSKDYEYFTEREFIDANGNYFRPDRLAYNPSSREVYIIDYKTGQPNDQYRTQLQHYQQNLTAIGWQVKGKYLVYLDLGEVVKI
ncbi:exodeoxyribonuclease V subunit beta [Capnocytophaga sp. oral taxon 864]|uniref:UvrD-helicase domain-containing protein n=1 Tax=Capnocytophaga sp. oral taxon 864 TaxID=1316593 RepID=UPI000D03A4A6|nr:UvrD-helicase domain-containing protein [Capnocytophaga sp. oral taxon 864]AVM56165.1 DNA helicase UvrD [Capnocytophaga sp. oral taxon 864]